MALAGWHYTHETMSRALTIGFVLLALIPKNKIAMMKTKQGVG